MNEKQLLDALGPYIDELVAVVKRMDVLERQPGPPGKDASLDDMLVLLKTDPAFRGDPGKDAQGPSGDEVVALLKSDSSFLDSLRVSPDLDALVKMLVEKHEEKLRGAPGKDADPVDLDKLAAHLVEHHHEALKGRDGDPGKDGDPGVGAPGDPGKDADPDLIVKILMESPTFIERVKGKDGEPGKDGDPGEAATPLDPTEVAKALMSEPTFLESVKGDPGESIKGDPGESVKGDPGKDGLDGVGLLVPVHEVNKVYREGSLVTAFIGQYYRAKCDTAAAPGDSDDWERIGTAGFRWRGLKPEEKSLKLGDIFVDNGSLFGFLGTKASMMVQRPKPAPHVVKVTVKGADLILGLSTGDDLVTPLPYDPNATKTIESLSEKVMVLDEALRAAEDTIRQLVEAVKTLDERSDD